MAAIASVLVVVTISLIVTRVATVALTVTGLSSESARFQARSALTGTGFTTSEAEAVVSHPVRRRIVMMLMLFGSAGVVTVVASLMISFANANAQQSGIRVGILVAGLVAILLLARSERVDRVLRRVIARLLSRYTDLDVRDYGSLLHLREDYAVMELAVRERDWLANRTLRELDLREEGVAVLAIQHANGSYRGAPAAGTRILPGDTVVVYGRRARVCELDERPAGPEGDRMHDEAADEQRRVLEEEAAEERAAAAA